MVQAVIFDVDGTLVDSVDHHARAWQDAFGDYGQHVALDVIRGQIGKGGDQLMPVFLTKEKLDLIGDDLEIHRSEILRERYLKQIKPFPGVRALFQRIIADGHRIVLASSAKGSELEHYKKLAEIDDLLDAETSSDDAEESKPHPDILLAALEKLGSIEPEEVLVVGDTPYDSEAAGKAGLRAIGVLCGGWKDGELKQAGCIAVYRDPEDLLACYDSSPLARRG